MSVDREDRSIPGQSFLRHSGDQVRSQKCRDRSGIEAADQIPISGYEGLDYRTMGTLAACAGESRGGENTPLLVPVRIDDQFTGFSFASMDFYTVTGKLWEIWLEYEDVFGRRFLRRASQETRAGGESKAYPGIGGPTGIIAHVLFAAQPWVTFPKNPES